MTTTENPARDEYFDLLLTEVQKYFECAIQKEPEQEERILSITYDPHVALQKRVEELEAAGFALIEAMNQKNFFLEGYQNGSASISEARSAMADEHAAYSKLFNTIKNKKS